jgi:hypothetical protein
MCDPVERTAAVEVRALSSQLSPSLWVLSLENPRIPSEKSSSDSI